MKNGKSLDDMFVTIQVLLNSLEVLGQSLSIVESSIICGIGQAIYQTMAFGLLYS